MSAFFLLAALLEPRSVACHDSLAVPDQAAESDDAIACLSGFLWKPTTFTATITPAADREYDYGVSFPSPVPVRGGRVC